MNKKDQKLIIRMSEISIKARQEAVKEEGLTIENYQVYTIDNLNLHFLKRIVKNNGYPKKGSLPKEVMFHFAHLLKDVSEADSKFVKECLRNSYIPEKYRKQIISLLEFHKKNGERKIKRLKSVSKSNQGD